MTGQSSHSAEDRPDRDIEDAPTSFIEPVPAGLPRLGTHGDFRAERRFVSPAPMTPPIVIIVMWRGSRVRLSSCDLAT